MRERRGAKAPPEEEPGDPQASHKKGEAGERETPESGVLVDTGKERSILVAVTDEGRMMRMKMHPAPEIAMKSAGLRWR